MKPLAPVTRALTGVPPRPPASDRAGEGPLPARRRRCVRAGRAARDLRRREVPIARTSRPVPDSSPAARARRKGAMIAADRRWRGARARERLPPLPRERQDDSPCRPPGCPDARARAFPPPSRRPRWWRRDRPRNRAARAAPRAPVGARLPGGGGEGEDRSGLPPLAPCRRLARLESSLAALPHLLRLAGGILARECDVRDLRQGHAHAVGGCLIEELDVRRVPIVDEPHQLGAVAAPQRDIAAIVECPLHQLGHSRIRHSRPVIMAATVAPIARGESKAARTALGSNPQCTMQSWQRGLPLLRPYFDQSVSSISSRKLPAYPSCSR